jgi:hypothetical protein
MGAQEAIEEYSMAEKAKKANVARYCMVHGHFSLFSVNEMVYLL